MKKRQRRSLWPVIRVWLLPVALGLSFFVYSLTQIHVYGISFDEPIHFEWGDNLELFFTSGDHEILQALVKHYVYGPLQYFLHYVLTYTLFSAFGLDLIAAYHVVTLALFSACIPFFFRFVERLGRTRMTAIIATGFLLLYPQILAHAQYNPKDIPMLAFVIFLFYALERVLRRDSWCATLAAGSVLGLALSLKFVIGFILLPIFLLSIACDSSVGIFHRSSIVETKRLLTRIAQILLIAFVVLALSWSMFWSEPALFWTAFSFFLRASFFTDPVLFLGTVYKAGHVPLFFYPLHLFIATPLFTALFAIVGISYAGHMLSARKWIFERAFPLLWLGVPLLLSLSPTISRYDGMRPFFFVVPALAILAADGFQLAISVLTKRVRLGRAMAVILTICMFFWLVVEVIRIHPFEGSYVNEGVRRIVPAHIERFIELEYWGAPYLQGVAWLNEHAEEGAEICAPIASFMMQWYALYSRSDMRFSCDDPTYVMFFTRFTLLPNTYTSLLDTQPVFTLSRYHSDLLYIYKMQ